MSRIREDKPYLLKPVSKFTVSSLLSDDALDLHKHPDMTIQHMYRRMFADISEKMANVALLSPYDTPRVLTFTHRRYRDEERRTHEFNLTATVYLLEEYQEKEGLPFEQIPLQLD